MNLKVTQVYQSGFMKLTELGDRNFMNAQISNGCTKGVPYTDAYELLNPNHLPTDHNVAISHN